MRRNDALVGLAWRLGLACLISVVAFFSAVSPWLARVLGMRLDTVIARVLNAPALTLSWMLNGLGGGVYLFVPSSPARMLVEYLSVGIPAYLVLLYLPMAIARLLRKRDTRELRGA